MARLPLKAAITRRIRAGLDKAAREGTPEDVAIEAAAHSAAVWLDEFVFRFNQRQQKGLALEAGSDWLVYNVIEPALIKLAKEVADDIAKGDDGHIWTKARTALADLKEKAALKRAQRRPKKS